MGGVSIHAPARGATKICSFAAYIKRRFNPRTREGCDQCQVDLDYARIMVSIHAPARGATYGDYKTAGTRIKVSIHAPARGATTRSHHICKSTRLFQSTHPRGVRPITRADTTRSGLFQSTHPRGVRQKLFARNLGIRWFQSTHPRGVRRAMPRATPILFCRFQSTHPRGVRLRVRGIWS